MANAPVDRIPAAKVITDPAALGRYQHDEAEWAPYGMPLAVVRPRSAEEVRDVVRFCLAHEVPVIARGAGTGLSGGANAVDGAVILSFEDMNQVLRIDTDERYAVVQPGVVNDDLRAACAGQGLWYPPDPASSPWSTIGGNVATNAGGMCCVKYGVTRDYVLELEMVNGRGELVRVGRRTAKGVAGYDLAGLMVGSEGTLGVITEITVRLRPSRPLEELVDRHCLAAVDAWKNMGLSADANVVLLGRIDTPGAEGDAEAERMRECFEKAGAGWAVVSTDQQEADALFQARRLAYPALERLGPLLTEDVCVPRMALPEMLRRIEEISQRHDIHVANVAHAGDGNLHPLIITKAGDEAAKARAQLVFDEILDEAIALGGTVTGEHGVGLLKMAGMDKELGEAVLGMHHAVKSALDPAGIFNPGKVVAVRQK
ncbi:FAD-binding oxidoreductase [Streptomyces sp. SM8]|uniref:FAD-binding oxidoreductase n=1 Tax=Streptomyces sp. SM8 TaxID=1195457 RepID=UPI000C2A4779|nr:FAD-linked oxidase C-terminal domain-containing protein [Streptomyces sp. SM8]PKA32988.1 FAD-binding oxidoreductase [Streptomyces sp. SM8]